LNASPIYQNRAAPTHALSATEPGTLQLEVISQNVNERGVRVRCDGASYTVDIKFDGPVKVQSSQGRLRLLLLVRLTNTRSRDCEPAFLGR
jgi:hypothetical protein